MEWWSAHAWQAWLGAAFVLGAAELFILDLTLLMLAIGALAGMALALVSDSLALQVIGACAASVALLGLVRPSLVRRLHSGPELQTGHTRLIGRQGVITAQATDTKSGLMEIGGETWTVRPAYPFTLLPGSTVEVVQIEGATAIVDLIEEPGSP